MKIPARESALSPPTLALGGLSIALSLLTAAIVARPDPLSSPPLIALLALAGAAILLSLRPETLFLSWLVLAPLLQNSADLSAIGRPLTFALYLAPPLVFALWTVTRPTPLRAPGFVDALPVGYLLFVVGSLFATGDPSAYSIRAVYTTLGIGVILYYFIVFGPIGRVSRERLIALLLLLSLLQAVMSIVDGMTGWNLWHDTGWQDGMRRAVATLSLPAILAAFIGMGIALALSVLVWDGPARLRRLAVPIVVLGIPGIFLTYTRAPILATVVVAVLILASRLRTRLVALGSLLLVVTFLAVSWSQITESTVYRERVTNVPNVQVRGVLQDLSLELAAERPLFGWGYDSFDRAKNTARLESGSVPHDITAAATSHNTYLTVLVQYGGIGFALFVIPFLAIVWRTLQNAFRYAEDRWFLVGSLGALGIYAATAAANDFRFFSFFPALAWLLLGLLRRHELEHQE